MLSEEDKNRLRIEYTNPFHQIPFDENRQSYEVVGCSDILQITVQTDVNGMISLYFAGEGCQLCLASASLMCRLGEGLRLAEIQELLHIAKEALEKGEKIEKFRELKFLETFWKKPNRKHCVALAWESLEKEIEKFKL